MTRDPEWRRLRVAKAREYCEHVGDLMTECGALSERARRIRERMDVGGIAYDGPQGSPNAYGDAIPDGVAALEEALGERDALINEAAAEVLGFQRCVQKVSDPRHRAVLDAKYVQGMTWAEVEQATNITERWCRELCCDALDELYDLMPHQWREMVPRAV